MFDYITAHAGELVAIVTAVVTVASLVANLTKTEADNKIIAKISKVINLLALNFVKK